MEFFRKFEKKFGRYAIPNLMYYIIMLYAVGLAVQLFQPQVYWQFLCLDANAILHGQIWRIVTFMMYPPAGRDIFWSVLGMFVYYSLGRTLEQVMGAFRFNVFFFMGVIGHVLAAIVAWAVFGNVVFLTTSYLNFSIFLAFAMYFPDTQFLVLFFFPVKAKWMAIAECVMYGYLFLMGNLPARLEIAMSLANVLLFFILTRNISRYSPKELKRRSEFKKAMAEGRVRIVPVNQPRHKCAVCGKTELDGDDLEFRYCSKCAGNYEYCMEHLYTHQHVVKDDADTKSENNDQP